MRTSDNFMLMFKDNRSGVKCQWEKGFTLVELLVTLVLSTVAAAGIYQIYVAFSSSYDLQDQMNEMNQNVRIAIDKMVGEIRMAGYNPTKTGTVGTDFGIITDSTATSLHIKMDLDGNGVFTGSAEDIIFAKSAQDELTRDDVNAGAGSNKALVDNLNALNFVYLDRNDTVVNPVTNPASVQRIQIAVVIRTTNPDYTYTNNRTYYNQNDDTIYTASGDNFRRKVLYGEVAPPNMRLLSP